MIITPSAYCCHYLLLSFLFAIKSNFTFFTVFFIHVNLFVTVHWLLQNPKLPKCRANKCLSILN